MTYAETHNEKRDRLARAIFRELHPGMDGTVAVKWGTKTVRRWERYRGVAATVMRHDETVTEYDRAADSPKDPA